MNTADTKPKQVKIRLTARAYTAVYRVRRRVATALGLLLAVVLAWHVVFGSNGLNNYEQKRAQNRTLQKQIQSLEQQNQQLKDHDARLKNDPDAIEFEAREKLHYARPGEVIYRLNQPQASNSDTAAPTQSSK